MVRPRHEVPIDWTTRHLPAISRDGHYRPLEGATRLSQPWRPVGAVIAPAAIPLTSAQRMGVAPVKKRLAVGLLAAGLATAMASSAAMACVPGCPPGDGWDLVRLSETIDLDVGNFHDQNGDGYVCRKINPGLSAKNESETWTVKDNTNPLKD